VIDRQTWKTLPGLKYPCIRDWVNTDHDCILALTFEQFLTEFHAAYLKEDWEETTRRQFVKVVKAAIGKLVHDSRGNGTRVQDQDLGRCILLNPGNITSTSEGMIGHLIFRGDIRAGNGCDREIMSD